MGRVLGQELQLLGSQRINEPYADWNAAGSYFVLILWIAIGVVWSARLRAWCTSVLPIPHRR